MYIYRGLFEFRLTEEILGEISFSQPGRRLSNDRELAAIQYVVALEAAVKAIVIPKFQRKNKENKARA